MKTTILLFLFLSGISALSAQQPLSRDEALAQIYKDYDPVKKTAAFNCPDGHEKDQSGNAWPCGDAVSVEVLLTAQVREDGTEKVYIVSSAKPVKEFECHACAPAIGIGVFAWKEQHWTLLSANSATGAYGGWGKPPEINLVMVGSEKHGLLLSTDDLAMGYAWSSKALLIPIEKTVAEVWGVQDEQDNEGAIDPSDKLNQQIPWHSSAALKFIDTENETGIPQDYYDIEVISRGRDQVNESTRLQSENWTEVYRFSNGEYRLLRHKNFVEVKKVRKKPAR